MRNRFAVIVSVAIGVSSTVVLAEPSNGLYAGAGLFYSSIDSETVRGGLPPGPYRTNGSPSGISFVFGNKWDHGNYNIGVELDGDISLDGETDGPCGAAVAAGPYMCEHKATLRLRGTVSKQVGAVEMFGAIGIGTALGDAAITPTATSSVSLRGMSIGAGVSFPVGTNMNIRGEVNYDDFGSSSHNSVFHESDYQATSVRLMAIYDF